jgi:oligopeptide transport system substrate-binding protein
MQALLLLILFLFGGCSDSSLPESDLLRINISEEPTSLDPRRVRDYNSLFVVKLLFEGLLRIGKEGFPEPALAESWEVSDDGLRYVFHLRKSRWSNHEKVTAQDVLHSWQTVLDPTFACDMAYMLYPIKGAKKAKNGEIGLEKVGIQAPDSKTLVVELELPCPYFLELLTYPIYFPVNRRIDLENSRWAVTQDTFVANGPFELRTWKPRSEIEVAQNSLYWDAKGVKLPGIQLLMVSQEAELQLFEEGELDWVGSPLSTLPLDAIAPLSAAKRLRISPFLGTCFLQTNTEPSVEGPPNPFACLPFRRAVSAALNRKEITEHILQGGQLPARSFVPPALNLHPLGLITDNNLSEAQHLLALACEQMNLSKEALSPIKVSFSNNPRSLVVLQAVQKQIENALGIKVELEPLEKKIFYDRLRSHDFQIAMSSWIADFSDPVSFLEVFKFKENSTNKTQWEHPTYIDLITRSDLCRDSGERRQIFREAEQLLMEQMPIIPIFHFAMNYLANDTVKDVMVSPVGQIDFRWAHKEASSER